MIALILLLLKPVQSSLRLHFSLLYINGLCQEKNPNDLRGNKFLRSLLFKLLGVSLIKVLF